MTVSTVRAERPPLRQSLFAAASYSTTKGTDRQGWNLPLSTKDRIRKGRPRRERRADTRTLVSMTTRGAKHRYHIRYHGAQQGGGASEPDWVGAPRRQTGCGQI